MDAGADKVSDLAVPLDADVFLRSLLRELAGTLEKVVGLDEASGYISIVGGIMGEHMNGAYRRALQVETLTREQIGEVLVDLKRRIEGDFHILEEREDRVVFGNRRCPFREHVLGRPSLCMMTSNVFGSIAAENLGYARVDIEQSIAAGDAGCRVTVYLTPKEMPEPNAREYFRREE
ncbi:methanogen output domain 1-containing protein (plasmid) [Cereibacter azotoformans]|uniref:methanogen output domain 1-containing protein n=1 Tax=Cereibacter azotoformans TaxID=43057 RepID=UPI000E35BD49|nr:methanogen output domain 1-containing protein [Cereibacter azotoformans]AXQ96090.1 transcriptional regulator [Cereibacter sphaeroides]UIJ32930.1 methanogen output domain 1-containing protein [Cereibacter azotoformans]